MKITFQKKSGHPALGITFFWRLELTARRPVTFTDHFIPELFYDFLYIKQGRVGCADPASGKIFRLPSQTLKTLHTRPLAFTFTTPLVLFGARLSLNFAEAYWGNDLTANALLKKQWVRRPPATLAAFAQQVTAHIQARQAPKNAHALLSPGLNETPWLASYSRRHKRRLYKATFGLSHKELNSLTGLHLFLEQTCSFASQRPRIIEHVNPEVFYDQPHLNHSFKKLTGFSPVDYFGAGSLLQDNLMAASYNEVPNKKDMLAP